MYVCIYIYIYTHVLCIQIHMCVYIYIYTHINNDDNNDNADNENNTNDDDNNEYVAPPLAQFAPPSLRRKGRPASAGWQQWYYIISYVCISFLFLFLLFSHDSLLIK